MNNVSKFFNKTIVCSLALSLLVSQVSVAGFWGGKSKEEIAAEEAARLEKERAEAQAKRVAALLTAVNAGLEFEQTILYRLGDYSKNISAEGGIDTGVFGQADATILRDKAEAVARGQEAADEAALDLAFGSACRACLDSKTAQSLECFARKSELFGALAGRPVVEKNKSWEEMPATQALAEARRTAIAGLLKGKAISQGAQDALRGRLEKTHELPELQEGDQISDDMKATVDELRAKEEARKAKAEFLKTMMLGIPVAPKVIEVVRTVEVPVPAAQFADSASSSDL